MSILKGRSYSEGAILKITTLGGEVRQKMLVYEVSKGKIWWLGVCAEEVDC